MHEFWQTSHRYDLCEYLLVDVIVFHCVINYCRLPELTLMSFTRISTMQIILAYVHVY